MPIECVQTDSEVEEFTKRFTSTKEETLPLFLGIMTKWNVALVKSMKGSMLHILFVVVKHFLHHYRIS